MQMKNTKSFFLLTICSIALFFGFYFLNEMQKTKQNQVAFSKFIAKIQVEADLYRMNYELNIKMTGLKAPEVHCEESQNERRDLSYMVKDKPLLIYRFEGSNCTPCLEDILKELLIQLSNSIDPDNVRMLVSRLTGRELKSFKRTHNIQIPIYIIPDESFDWIAEKNNRPYFFVLHPDMKISHIYVPNKDFPELNKQYLEDVKSFLSNGDLKMKD